MHGKFFPIILLIDKRIFYDTIIFQLAVFRSISQITIQEKTFTERRCRGSTDTEAGPLNRVTTDIGVHRTKLELALLRNLIRRDITGGKDRNNLLRHIENRNGTKFRH